MSIEGFGVNGKQQGFTLIEVLITVVLMSIGLLGLAGLQMTGIRGGQQALDSSNVYTLAWDMADRVRANPGGASGGQYDNLTSSPGSLPGCITSGCSPANLAAYDYKQWRDALASNLPEGVGSICRSNDISSIVAPGSEDCAGGPNAPLVVRIWWNHDQNPNTPLAYFGMGVLP